MKKEVILSAHKKILYLPHAVQQMSRLDRMITPAEVETTIFQGEIIESYPNDPRGQSCLIMHICDDRCIHVVCSPKLDYLAVITAYIPDNRQWDSEFKKRI